MSIAAPHFVPGPSSVIIASSSRRHHVSIASIVSMSACQHGLTQPRGRLRRQEPLADLEALLLKQLRTTETRPSRDLEKVFCPALYARACANRVRGLC